MTQQQYTPVSWQDETTSQQGTLINAERLNQMQTAHHYADGLEETDTVPTADPGVAYHKIVYCTADNTLYRWDGEAWTADIDDPTRELLEEHEADHDNPHQVTKAQVGLGNCDNTSDADKPISTATQTALNAKADKSDTYTKAQVDTALATKADKATTYTKTETDTLLGAKADKSTTYTKTEIDTVMATKADKATTLAGYGITDAYTKTEADTLLAGKASTTAVQTLDTRVGALETGLADTYNKSQTDTLLGAKADQATTYSKTETDTLLAGYVTLGTAQTIPGVKTFTGVPTILTGSADANNLNLRNNNITLADMTGGHNTSIAFRGDSDSLLARVRYRNGRIDNAPARNIYLDIYDATGTGHTFELCRLINNTTESWPALDSYEPMVRTTGNQPIGGEKTFTAPVTALLTRSARIVAGSNERYWRVATFTALTSRRYYAVSFIACRTSIMSIIGMNGQLLNGVYTASLNILSNATLGNQAYIGIGTVDGESCLIIRTTRQVTLNIDIKGIVSGTQDTPDGLVIDTPAEITAPADYVEGGAIL